MNTDIDYRYSITDIRINWNEQSERETRAYRIFAILHKSRLALPSSRRILDELLTADKYTDSLFRRACWLPARTIGWSATAGSGRSWGSSPSTSAGSSSLNFVAMLWRTQQVTITFWPRLWLTRSLRRIGNLCLNRAKHSL